ncbi:MAG: hypothetical protein COA73_03910 [Candidatus Hydrogenedentota bacterium]|nr:MAG: hypothetical protein COA73_03910 [Candidatus Hydrogenedentota bacterium]
MTNKIDKDIEGNQEGSAGDLAYLCNPLLNRETFGFSHGVASALSSSLHFHDAAESYLKRVKILQQFNDFSVDVASIQRDSIIAQQTILTELEKSGSYEFAKQCDKLLEKAPRGDILERYRKIERIIALAVRRAESGVPNGLVLDEENADEQTEIDFDNVAPGR